MINIKKALENAAKCKISEKKALEIIEEGVRLRKEIRKYEKISTGGCGLVSEEMYPRLAAQMDSGVLETSDGKLIDGHCWIYLLNGCIVDPTQDQFDYYDLKGPDDFFFVPPGSIWYKRYHGYFSGSKDAKLFINDDGSQKEPPNGKRWI